MRKERDALVVRLARDVDAALAVVGSGHSVALVRADTGRVALKWKAGAAPGAPALTCVDCTKDGGTVAVGTAAGTVLLYDVRKTSAPFATATATTDGRRVAAVRFIKTKTASAQSTRSTSQRRPAPSQPPSVTQTAPAPLQPSPIHKRTVHLELDRTVDQIPQQSQGVGGTTGTTAGAGTTTMTTTWDTTVSSDVSQETSLSQPPSKQQRVAQSQRALVESARALMAGDSAAQGQPWMATSARQTASPPRLPSSQPLPTATTTTTTAATTTTGGNTITQSLSLKCQPLTIN